MAPFSVFLPGPTTTPLPHRRIGMGLLLVGELGNFAAYGFAGASVITPLGGVSVVANAFISSLMLGELMRFQDVAGGP